MKTKPIINIAHEIGLCYKAATRHPELSAHRAPSSATVLENGLVLPGPSNAIHDEIRKLGSGRYCFWHRMVYFSTPDNSDPRTNGRTYAIAYTPALRNIFVLVVPPRLWKFAERCAGRVVRIGRRIPPIRAVGRWILRDMCGLLRFASRWIGRAVRFSRRIKPVPIFWGSLYWTCFGIVLVRGELKRVFTRARR